MRENFDTNRKSEILWCVCVHAIENDCGRRIDEMPAETVAGYFEKRHAVITVIV